MTIKPDWAAPIVPGKSIMGFELGTAYEDILTALERYRCGPGHVRFDNSPVMRISVNDTSITLCQGIHKPSIFDEVASLHFDGGILTSIVLRAETEQTDYRGKLFGNIGMGSKVAELKQHCKFAHDDAEEEFYLLGEHSGLVVGGYTDLFEEPDQTICFLKVFKARTNDPWTYCDYTKFLESLIAQEMSCEDVSGQRACAVAQEYLEDHAYDHPLELPMQSVALAATALKLGLLNRLPLDEAGIENLRCDLVPDYVAENAKAMPPHDRQSYIADAAAVRTALDRLPATPPWTYLDYEAALEVEIQCCLEPDPVELVRTALRTTRYSAEPRFMAHPLEEPLFYLAAGVCLIERGMFDRPFVTLKGWRPGLRTAADPDQVAQVKQTLPGNEQGRYLSHVERLRNAFSNL